MINKKKFYSLCSFLSYCLLFGWTYFILGGLEPGFNADKLKMISIAMIGPLLVAGIPLAAVYYLHRQKDAKAKTVNVK